jgi:hypothetical protein
MEKFLKTVIRLAIFNNMFYFNAHYSHYNLDNGSKNKIMDSTDLWAVKYNTNMTIT